MIDSPDLTILRGSRSSGAGTPGPDCLNDLTLAACVDGALDEAQRDRALRHVAECQHCRRALTDVTRLADIPEVAIIGTRRSPRRVPVRLVTAAAAAAVLLVAGVQWLPQRDAGHRAPITAAPAPVPIGPQGNVESIDAFRWEAVDRADRYRVTLYGPDGDVRYDAEVTETRLVLPDSVTLPRGTSTWWRVDARLGFDRWVASPLVQFTVTGSTPE